MKGGRGFSDYCTLQMSDRESRPSRRWKDGEEGTAAEKLFRGKGEGKILMKSNFYKKIEFFRMLLEGFSAVKIPVQITFA